jgi:hypothetical protein
LPTSDSHGRIIANKKRTATGLFLQGRLLGKYLARLGMDGWTDEIAGLTWRVY